MAKVLVQRLLVVDTNHLYKNLFREMTFFFHCCHQIVHVVCN